MAHFNFVISQNAKWGHAGFYTDCHRMTSYRKIFFYKKALKSSSLDPPPREESKATHKDGAECRRVDDGVIEHRSRVSPMNVDYAACVRVIARCNACVLLTSFS